MNAIISKREQRLRHFGKWVVTPLFSLGSAIITSVAIASFPFISGLALPWFILVILAVSLTELGVSLYTFKNSVPDTLVDVFANNIFKGLTPAKKAILGMGIFSALGGGLAIGALTYLSGVTAISAVLSLLALSFPPLGIAVASLLALTGFVAVSSLFIKRLAYAIKNDLHQKIVPFFKKIFTRDFNKPLGQQILEGFFKLLFTLGIMGVLVIGTIATLGTMQRSLSQLLSLIPNANTIAIKISSGIITYALFGLARLPLILQSVCEIFSQAGEALGRGIFKMAAKLATFMGVYKPAPTRVSGNQNQDSNFRLTLPNFVISSALLVNAASSAALARSGGGGEVVSDVMSHLHFPLSPTSIAATGQVASVVSKGIISLGMNAYTFFGDDKKAKSGEEENSLSRNSEIELTELRKINAVQ